MKKTLLYVLSAAALLPAASSCSFLDEEPTVICSDNFYTSEQDVRYGLAGVYGAMASENFYGYYYPIILSQNDDLCYFNRNTTANYPELYAHDATSSNVYNAWVQIYRGIKNANAFMEAVKDSEFDPDHLYYNEARFLRAYYHFILAQAWGDVPLRDYEVTGRDQVMCPATPQHDVLSWVVSEMEDCISLVNDDLNLAPSRITDHTVEGILARVYLFMAGATVQCSQDEKREYYRLAMEHAGNVISSGEHRLNEDYSQVFINMISDKYDTEYRESMWEVDFLGDCSSPDKWTNGRIGDLLGLQSTINSGFENATCNFAYGQYNGSLKLWDLYWQTDRTDDENAVKDRITDSRQDWNMPPFNFRGDANNRPFGEPEGSSVTGSLGGIDPVPYVYGNVRSDVDLTVAAGQRNCGKWRRMVEWEGLMTSKMLYTTINFPILRYADVLLMYAEAYNEYYGAPDEKVFKDCIVAIRDRAGIATRPFGEYSSQEAFRQLVRNERGRELCFEALRKYDLIRWGIFVESVREYNDMVVDVRFISGGTPTKSATTIGQNVAERHVYLPIPSVELGVNKELVQNPLW